MKSVFGRERKTTSKTLESFGLDVLRDDKMDQRQELTKEIHALIEAPIDENLTAEQRLKKLEDRIRELDRLIRVAHIPFGRAGDEATYRLMMEGYEEIRALDSFLTSSVRSVLKKEEDPSEKLELIRKLEWAITSVRFKAIHLICDASWRREDVAPSYAITIHQMAPPPKTIPYGYGPPRPPEGEGK